MDLKTCFTLSQQNKKNMSAITPLLNQQVLKRACEIAKEKNWEGSQKSFNKAFNLAIKEFGYTPAYYHSILRKIGPEYPED